MKVSIGFFARGQGTFLGSLNPLSLSSIIESCVFPVLLNGAESCILNLALLKHQVFPRRLLRGYCDFPSSSLIRLSEWLCYGHPCRHVFSASSSHPLVKRCWVITIKSCIFRTLVPQRLNHYSSQQCHFLESHIGTSFTATITEALDEISVKNIKNIVLEVDAS